MAVDVDTINLEVEITGKGHLSYCGHFVDVEYTDSTVTLLCSACGHSEELHHIPQERKWTAILYLLGRYDDGCDGNGRDLEERIEKILDRYTGKPADQARLAALENDVRDVVGEGVAVNIRGGRKT